jgi:hypothetical protein
VDSPDKILDLALLNHVVVAAVLGISQPQRRNPKEAVLHFDTGQLARAFGTLGLAWQGTVEDFSELKVELFVKAAKGQ